MLEIVEVTKKLKGYMDKIYNKIDEQREPIKKRWENLKNVIKCAAKITLNEKRKNLVRHGSLKIP